MREGRGSRNESAMNSLCDIVEKLFGLALLRTGARPYRKKRLVRVAGIRVTFPRGRQGNTSFRQLSEAYHRAKLQPDAKKCSASQEASCLHHRHRRAYAYFMCSLAARQDRRAQRRMTYYCETKGDGNFNREESRVTGYRSGGFAEDGTKKPRDQKYPDRAAIMRDR